MNHELSIKADKDQNMQNIEQKQKLMKSEAYIKDELKRRQSIKLNYEIIKKVKEQKVKI